MTDQNQRHIRVAGAFNLRDLGGYAIAGGGRTRWRSFLRSDGLHDLTPADIEILTGYGLATVIDLRSEAELAWQASAFASHESVAYHHIPLFDGLAPLKEFASSGERLDLAHRYMSAAETCRERLVEIAGTMASAPGGAILFNCTVGKDRTGVVAAMLLSLAGASEDDIVADYALTATCAAPLIQRLRSAGIMRGLSEEAIDVLLGAEAATMRTLLRHMDEQYGGFRNYLLGDGADENFLAPLLERLVERDSQTGPA